MPALRTSRRAASLTDKERPLRKPHSADFRGAAFCISAKGDYMKTKNGKTKLRRGKAVSIRYNRRVPPSDAEAAEHFKVGFWKHRHGTGNKKGVNHHPAYVYARKGQFYRYIGITEDDHAGHHKNGQLSRNPDRSSGKAAYIRRPEKDHYRNFTGFYPDWYFAEKDREEVMKKIKK